MNREEELFPIGYLARTHGVQGGLILKLEERFHPHDFETTEFVFVELDGIRVPFFVLQYKSRNASTAIVYFEDIGSEPQAQKLVGRPAFVDALQQSEREPEADTLSVFDQMLGYEAYDIHHGHLGQLHRYDAIPGNELWAILRPDGSELLVPAHPHLLHQLLVAQREIYFSLPEGFLDI